VLAGLAAHHAGAHWVGHAELGSRLGVGFANLGVIRQAKVVVQTPGKHFLPPESHSGLNFSFKLWERKISMALFLPLANWPHVFNLIKYIHGAKI
jgi:hypothetical protein